MAVPDVVVVDHHDSYTWNLVHLVAAVTGRLPRVVQHDEVDAADVLRHSHVILSPGPGHPTTQPTSRWGARCCAPRAGRCWGCAWACRDWSRRTAARSTATYPPMGRWPGSSHDGEGVFRGLPQAFAAVRYHSLAAVALPDDLVATAHVAGSGAVMGVRHVYLPLEGVQFHPESILSEHGAAMVANFLGPS